MDIRSYGGESPEWLPDFHPLLSSDEETQGTTPVEVLPMFFRKKDLGLAHFKVIPWSSCPQNMQILEPQKKRQERKYNTTQLFKSDLVLTYEF